MTYILTPSRTTGNWQALDSIDGKLVAEAATKEALEAFMWSHGWKPVEAL